MTVAIRIESISKQYRLGEIGTGSLAHDVNRWWHRVRGKEDPYLRIGETNDRAKKGESEYVWSLRDVSFDIKQGEVVGIIGRNGAGKSTLLKILSRVTSPTTGTIKTRGRIASLLEVGTGFHPELTGRENIYLNGAILGMRKHEITRKLDEIIDFSGCERYIDTPVKRYSSGMYVRLAFAVAAHLDPEIMIIDEVLAVGDGDFQKKCLGKMRDMHHEGRTVIIVSHQMSMISALCTSGVILEKGELAFTGTGSQAVLAYHQRQHQKTETQGDVEHGDARFLGMSIHNRKKMAAEIFDRAEDVFLAVEYELLIQPGRVAYPNFHVKDEQQNYVFITSANEKLLAEAGTTPGRYRATVQIPRNLLNCGTFSIGVAVTVIDTGVRIAFYEADIRTIHVTEDLSLTLDSERNGHPGVFPGPLRPALDWNITALC